MTNWMYQRVKEYANDRDIDIPRALGELVAAGLGTKSDALETSYRAFEEMNSEVCKEWEGVSREATDLLGPPPAIETENCEVWNRDQMLKTNESLESRG